MDPSKDSAEATATTSKASDSTATTAATCATWNPTASSVTESAAVSASSIAKPGEAFATTKASAAFLTTTARASNALHSACFTTKASDALRELARPDSLSAIAHTVSATAALRQSLNAGLVAADYLRAHRTAMETSARSLAAISDALKPPAFQTSLSVLNSTLKRLSAAATFSEEFKGIAARHAALLSVPAHVSAQLDAFAATQRVAGPYLGAASSLLSFESSFAQLARVNDVGSSIARALSTSGFASMQANLASLSVAASASWKNLERLTAPQPMTLEWLRRPAVELYTATQVVAAVADEAVEELEKDEEIEDSLDERQGEFEALLARLNPDLLPVYRGGIERLERGGTDWERHAMTSFRELATHILHLLSPDKEVLMMADVEIDPRGRPTRRARFRFIFGRVADGAVTDFFDADMKAAIALFEELNRGTHKLGHIATAAQVRYLRSRLVGLVTSLIEARNT